MRHIGLLFLGALAAACSSAHKLVQPDPVRATPIAAATATTGAADRPESAVNRELLQEGYQPGTYRGQMVYCRHEKLTGSQFSHKICLSEEQIKLQRKIAQDLLGTVRGLGKCLPPQCNN